MKVFLLMVYLFLWASLCQADEPFKVFQSDSLAEITKTHKDKPFILIFWSIDCPPCLIELANIQKFEQQFTPLKIVYVSTDSIEQSSDILKVLNSFQLEDREHWVFANVMPERLRYAIDPNWYGELPRSYFYDESLKRTAHSGILSSANLQQWVTKNGFY